MKRKMLLDHLNHIERRLLAQAAVQVPAGHPNHKGTPREAFIREFLDTHLSRSVAVGTGEIIDAASKPGEARNQIDIVLYRDVFPRLDFGGGINAFLVESVIAGIEVKSRLDRDAVFQVVSTGHRIKQLKRSTVSLMSFGSPVLLPLYLAVAYDGPSDMDIVHRWVKEAHEELGIALPNLPPSLGARQGILSPALDGIFVLGKGFLQFDNQQVSFFRDEIRVQHPDFKWVNRSGTDDNLALLFMILTAVLSRISMEEFDPAPYVEGWTMDNLHAGT